jgi:hypothetical protein
MSTRRLQLTLIVALVALSLATCRPTEAVRREMALAEGRVVAATLEVAPPAPQVPSIAPAAFLSWVVSSCRVDALEPSTYTAQWVLHAQHFGAPEGALLPIADQAWRELPPRGSRDAHARIDELGRAWRGDAGSHVVDCSFEVPKRHCEGCKDRGAERVGRYVAYLPAALFERPETVRSVLLLVPGGRGGRSRPFLAAIAGKSHYDRGSGGLDTRRLADDFYREHPDAAQSIIVALDGHGQEMINGATEYLATDLPDHLASTYLPHVPREELVLGAEGLSSGARAIMRTLYAREDAFHSVGLSCMQCGAIDLRVWGRLGPRGAVDAWMDRLALRSRRGDLAMRFAIGSRDGQLDCNEAYHRALVEHGVLEEQEGLTIYPGEMHHYGFVAVSYPDQLAWHLERLAARAGGASA